MSLRVRDRLTHPNVVGLVPFALALAIRSILEPALGDRSPFLLFALAVVAASIYGGLVPAVATTLLGGTAGLYFLADPAPGGLLFAPKWILQVALYFAVCAGIVYLIHALRRARAQIEAYAREQAQLARALTAATEAKGHLLAAVSHDLRTPLNAIMGWSSLLKKGALDEAQAASALDTIERSAVAQQHLLSDLLDLSSMEERRMRLRLRPLDALSEIEHLVQGLRPAAQAKGITIDIAGSPGVVLQADPDRLQQMLGNLLANAVRFTPQGGRVIVDVNGDASHVRVRVRDDGPGIPLDLLPQVFEPFQHDTGPNGGFGLGLAIARQLVEIHGGAIAASNNPGGGALFEVTLPRCPPTCDPPVEPEPAGAAQSF